MTDDSRKKTGRGGLANLGRGAWTLPLFIAMVILISLVIARPVENFYRDILMAAVSPFTEPDQDIVFVTVTEETLEEFPYRSPIDRGFLADLVEHIAQAGPKAIGLDILFDQPTEADKDLRLAEVIGTSPVPIVIASAGVEDGLSQSQADYLAEYAPGTARGLATLGRDSFDGVVRDYFAGRQTGEEFVPGFSSALAQAAGAGRSDERQALVYYRTDASEPYPFPAYPAHAAKLLPSEWFADKFVLIGVDLPLDDRHRTPFAALIGVKDGTLPGVVIHGHKLAQILNGDRSSPAGPIINGAGLLVTLLLACWLAWRPLPVLIKPIAISAVILGYWVLSVLAYARWAVHIPVVAPSIIIAGIAGAVSFVAWRRDRQERRFVERAFSQYVSPAVVKHIVKNPKMLTLGGEKRDITCVFTDLQGFTSISEKLTPEEIATVLNGYLDSICNLFVEHGATIDKVIGDAVVGFFGAPTEQEDQADRAVSLALAVDGLSEKFRKEMQERGLSVGITRIGIHSGPAIVGNFGGERFFDYTAIGDTVNTAARLEGANKYVGTRICVSGETAKRSNAHLFRPSGTIYLKGKVTGIEAFEPMGDNVEQSCLEEYDHAFELLRTGNKSAKKAFADLVKHQPGDSLAGFHLRRLENGETGADIVLSEK
ncbi:MAG: adenylate/guanylate cyclase domain-containing protein [Pseudomonadota bacterium]